MSSGGQDPSPPTGDKGKRQVVSTNRRHKPRPRINTRDDNYVPIPSTQSDPPIQTTDDTCVPIASTQSDPPIQPTGTSTFTPDIGSSGIPDTMVDTPHTFDPTSGGNATRSTSQSDGDDGVDIDELQDDYVEEEYLRDGRVIIRPVGDSFLPSKPASKAITAVIKEKYQQPWTTWKEIKSNKNDKAMMFNAFKSKCTWDKEHEAHVEKNFHRRAAARLADMFRDARQIDKRPKWIGVNIWEVLCQHWRGEKWHKSSEVAKKNRASEKGGSLHTGGSINTAQIRERMERTLKRPVPLHELHRRVHIRKSDNDFVDERSRLTQVEFEKQMTQYRSQTQQPLTPEEESYVQLSKWVDVAGGKYKGRVYGAGVLSACYKEGASNLDATTSSNSSTGRSHTDDVVRRLATAEREAIEAKKGQAELQSKVDQMAEQQSQMQRQLSALMQQQARPPPPHQQYYYVPPQPHQYFQSQAMPPSQQYYVPQPLMPQSQQQQQQPRSQSPIGQQNIGADDMTFFQGMMENLQPYGRHLRDGGGHSDGRRDGGGHSDGRRDGGGHSDGGDTGHGDGGGHEDVDYYDVP